MRSRNRVLTEWSKDRTNSKRNVAGEYPLLDSAAQLAVMPPASSSRHKFAQHFSKRPSARVPPASDNLCYEHYFRTQQLSTDCVSTCETCERGYKANTYYFGTSDYRGATPK